MSERSAWLAARRPAPPSDLAARMDLAPIAGALQDGLAADGRARLELALARLGRVRESAFRLLEADALITYACEAALELDDPEAALRRILVATAGTVR
jgi:hypothetical protein